jgi:hypothetical protein
MVNGSPTGRIVGNASRKKGTFMKDMKKHGIIGALNDVNKFTEFFEQSASPGRNNQKDAQESFEKR